MKVRFTLSAKSEFLNALAYIAQDKPDAASKLKNLANEKLQRLREFPGSGRRIPEFPHLPYREVLVKPYRFFYRVQGQTVWIVAVWHDAQLPETPDTEAMPNDQG